MITAETQHVAAVMMDGWTYQAEPSSHRIQLFARHVAVAKDAGITFEVVVRQPCRGEDEDHGANLVRNVYLSWRRLYREFRADRLPWSKLGAFEKDLPKSLVSATPWQTRREFFRSVLFYESQYARDSKDRLAARTLLDKLGGLDRKAEVDAKWGLAPG